MHLKRIAVRATPMTASPFYRAFSTANGGKARETDLFEGIG
jgi:hypothetical protein